VSYGKTCSNNYSPTNGTVTKFDTGNLLAKCTV
jgi:hypothetical protein